MKKNQKNGFNQKFKKDAFDSRFIAERGDSAQLTFIDKIDEAYGLKPMPHVALTMKKSALTASPEKPLAGVVPKAPR